MAKCKLPKVHLDGLVGVPNERKIETAEEAYSRILLRIKQANAFANRIGIDCVFSIHETQNMVAALRGAHNREVAAKNALIKELADVLDGYLACECTDCGSRCPESNLCDHQKSHRALVKKARDMAK